MEAHAYLEMAATEDRHWWFVARRRILTRLIQGLALPADARILEIGAGTGGNLAMLAGFGVLEAVEGEAAARDFARRKNIAPVHAGCLPDQLPAVPGSYDLVCLFDVLEHVAEDHAALLAIRRLLKPAGRVLLTVPAYPWLWSHHDVQLHHQRRYRRADLRRLAMAAGFACRRLSHFNMFLLPLVMAGRLVDRWRPRGQDLGTAIPAAPLNFMLREIFAAEGLLLPYIDLPAGASLYAELA